MADASLPLAPAPAPGVRDGKITISQLVDARPDARYSEAAAGWISMQRASPFASTKPTSIG